MLIDATVAQAGALRFMQCLPLAEDRLIVADVMISECVLPDAEAGARLDAYVAARGWKAKGSGGERTSVRPLPAGGDFAAFWRQSGARVAKLGPRGGFVHPVTPHLGRAVAPRCRPRQRQVSGTALQTCSGRGQAGLRRRELRRGNSALAAAGPEEARACSPGSPVPPATIARFHADRLGVTPEARPARAQGPLNGTLSGRFAEIQVHRSSVGSCDTITSSLRRRMRRDRWTASMTH